jgi:hypothetical protein
MKISLVLVFLLLAGCAGASQNSALPSASPSASSAETGWVSLVAPPDKNAAMIADAPVLPLLRVGDHNWLTATPLPQMPQSMIDGKAKTHLHVYPDIVLIAPPGRTIILGIPCSGLAFSHSRLVTPLSDPHIAHVLNIRSDRGCYGPSLVAEDIGFRGLFGAATNCITQIEAVWRKARRPGVQVLDLSGARQSSCPIEISAGSDRVVVTARVVAGFRLTGVSK